MASVLPYYVSLLLFIIPVFTSAQAYHNITLGSSLSTNDEYPFWASLSGEFAFGFKSLAGKDLFLVAIWFQNVTNNTIVWTANQGQPMENGSKIQLTNGGIALTDNQGNQIWSANSTDNSLATSAAMLDTGSFVLSNGSSIIWSSFDNPTDTMLPSQILDSTSKLTSRLTEENYTAGRFELHFQANGNLLFSPIARPTDGIYYQYWEIDAVGSDSKLVFNQSGYLYMSLSNGSLQVLGSENSSSVRDFYQIARLDFDGVFRLYMYPKSETNGSWPQSWSVSSYVPSNICMATSSNLGSGVCGFNSYCKLDNEQRPSCECPNGYVPLDLDNPFNGCRPNFSAQICEDGFSNENEFQMEEIPSTDWPTGDYEHFLGVNEAWCRENCINDCLCAAAITRDSSCWKKKYPLSNGRMDPSVGGKALIKVGYSSTAILNSTLAIEKKGNALILPGSILLGSSVFFNCLLLLAIFLVFHSYHKKLLKTTPQLTRTFGTNLRCFTYKELEDATDGFKEEVGNGGCSTVYKGALQFDSLKVVAIKRLDKVAEQSDLEFKTEVSAIGNTNHKNLVQLLGYCNEGLHRLLVYEFMSNGSLASFLFGSLRPKWYHRVQIACGIARGLTYLHEECNTQIIHCDVKPQNILLDDIYVARICDFGLAKLLKTDQTRTTTGVRGTRGYVAPEWFKNMAITAKVDVYGFGVVLLEIICCRKNVESMLLGEDKEILSEWAYECYKEGNLHLLVGNDEDAISDGRKLKRFIMVAIWCIQEDPSLRPSMKKVTQMLEGAVEVSAPPDPASFISAID